MTTEKKVIDQKEYLKKYLSSGSDEKKKKKKKKAKVGAQTVKIIDDDVDLKNMRPVDENEFDIFIDGEDAPQIAGVVDERGPVDFTDKRRWKIIAADEGGDLTITSSERGFKQLKQIDNNSDDDLSPIRKHKKYGDENLSPPRTSKGHKITSKKSKEGDDLSPPRLKSKKFANSEDNVAQSSSDNDINQEADLSSYENKKRNRKKEKESSDSDLSLPRKSGKRKHKKSSKHRNEDDSDLSPPRIRKHQNYDSDLSPPRIKNKKNYDSDLSPPRNRKNKNYDSDLSPLRKNKKSGKRDSDSDLSPPRIRKNKNYDSDLSPPRRSKRPGKRESDSDLSPPRKPGKAGHMGSTYKDQNYEADFRSRQRKERNNDFSPQRLHKYKDERMERNGNHRHSNRDFRPSRRNYDGDKSSNRYRRDDRDFGKSKSSKSNDRYDRDSKYSHREESYKNQKTSKHRDIDEEVNDKRMKKTLDGKKAGLQDARALREETEAHKKREAEQFSKLSKEVTGAGQAAIVRDTKTGRKRNLEAEAAEEREKQKRQEELNEKYAKWGRGLKQVEDREEKLKEDLYEMSKPLARYADDADLDRKLREQEREGDPMLEYIKQKQIKEGKRKPDRPTYEGSFMPNRFGIKPGHRWDGVDRSNGYEKRWFEAQNAKKARQEEAYKWSTSDM